MTEKEILTRKFMLVKMYEARISTEEKPIIGTQALHTCIGVILYSEEKKKAIVAHVAPGQKDIIDKLVKLIVENNLAETTIKYKIISGYHEEHYNTKKYLEKNLNFFTEIEETDNAIETDEKYESRQFAFDASTGQFVTDQVLFGQDYSTINPEKSEHDEPTTKRRKS